MTKIPNGSVIELATVLHLKRSSRGPRPFILHTEDGRPLPNQMRVAIDNETSTVTVTFFLDGEKIKVKGDE